MGDNIIVYVNPCDKPTELKKKYIIAIITNTFIFI